MHTGVLSASLVMRLQHMCDAVLALEAVQDDSPAVRLLSDPDRYMLRSIHKLSTAWQGSALDEAT